MSKKKAFLFIGPPIAGVDELHESFTAEMARFGAAGVAVPAVKPDTMFRASVEILRQHKAEGLRRKDVEGSWASVCRTAEKTRSNVVIAQDRFVGASAEQVALLLDGLAAFQVHVVVADGDSAEDLWALQVKPHRLHRVAIVDDDPVPALTDEIATIALRVKAEQLTTRIDKLRKKRKKIRKRLQALDAA